MDVGKGWGIQGILDDTHFPLLQADVQLWFCHFRVLEIDDRGVVSVDPHMAWGQFSSTCGQVLISHSRKQWSGVPSLSDIDLRRTFSANGMCMTT